MHFKTLKAALEIIENEVGGEDTVVLLESYQITFCPSNGINTKKEEVLLDKLTNLFRTQESQSFIEVRIEKEEIQIFI